MIGLTPYSILTVTAVTCVFIVLFMLITQMKAVFTKIPMWLTVTLTVVMCLRLLFPVEFLFFSNTILSFEVFPHIDDVFYTDIPIIKSVVPESGFTIVNLFCTVWIIGAVCFVLRYLYRYYNLCKAIKYISPADDPLIQDTLDRVKAEHNFKFDVKVIVNKAIPSPSEFGFFKQIIFLNDYSYSQKELEYIFIHELTHFYNKSNWVKLFMDMVKSILWWNPLMYILQRHIDNLLEIYVDTYVVKNKNADYKLGYILSIYNVFKLSRPVKRSDAEMSYVHSMAAFSGKRILKTRFETIETGYSRSNVICACVLVFMLSYVFISGRYVVQPGYEPDDSDLYVPEFTSENSYIVKDGDKYVIYYNGEPYLATFDIDGFNDIPIAEGH